MKKVKKLFPVVFFCLCCLACTNTFAHDIIFCGERIPVDNNFVSTTLMDVIRRQIPNVNLPELRKRAEQNFPLVEYYLNATGLPDDLKYLAIVESGFLNQTSQAGASGFWQLMPNTARELGLIVSDNVDERNNINKSTYAACKVLAGYYLQIRKRYNISSWVLTAAAYDTGIGNLLKKMNNEGNDYFSMNLNAETALYVYKIIAVKELFEYPELYMKDFGYNVFSTLKPPAISNMLSSNTDQNAFTSMVVNVRTNDGEHPDSVSAKEPADNHSYLKSLNNTTQKQNAVYVAANVKGKYKSFSDGQLIAIQLQENLTVNGVFNKKGNIIKGVGWFIDDRIFIDLGYEDHAVTLINNGKKGIDVSQLKNDQPVLLKILTQED